MDENPSDAETALPTRASDDNVDESTFATGSEAFDTADVDRRGFLRCMAWAGTGMLWTMSGGVPISSMACAGSVPNGDLFFVQISDSHIGFNKAANADVTETMRTAVA